MSTPVKCQAASSPGQAQKSSHRDQGYRQRMASNKRSIGLALFTRVILVTHMGLAVWRVSVIGVKQFWLLGLPVILMLPETIYFVFRRFGKEHKWVCTCFVIYLASTIPAIWLLELDRLHKFVTKNEDFKNRTNLGDESIAGVNIPFKLDADTWVAFIEQTLLFLLIFGRWLLPRGRLTRDQLSQLLFVFIGMASDIMELFVMFDEPKVRNDFILTVVVLAIWTVSLFQFCLVLTATMSPKKSRVSRIAPTNQQPEKNKTCKCLETEVWSLLVSLCMQDGPFLVVRLYVIIVLEVMTYSIIFFICKNSLLVFLILYRLSVVLCFRKGDKDKDDDDDNSDDEDHGGVSMTKVSQF